MSYIKGLGALSIPAISMTRLAVPATMMTKPPFPGAVWNPPAGGKAGFWSRGPSTGAATVTFTDSPTNKLKKECLAKGYPQRVCVQIKDGWTMKDVEKAAGDFANRNIRERRPEKLAEQCAATGMPPELIPQCVEGLLANVSMDEILATLQEQSAGGEAPRGGGSNILLYGGIAAAGLVAFLFLRKKKKS